MRKYQLSDMTGGWFVGRFEPTCMAFAECEVAIKHYRAGMCEATHVHRVATELTAVVQGRVEINGVEFGTGDIVLLEPNEPGSFRVIEDSITVVVKSPCVSGDKYLI